MVGRYRQDLTGSTRLVGLIGEDVSRSLSLLLHNEAFASLELDWAYVPLPVPNEPHERLGDAVRGLRALGFVGANVTMPYKVAVLPYLDELTATARRIGAVNTIRVDDSGRLIGGNTDGVGFLADLGQQGVDWREHPALILGAGGAARAVANTLAERNCPHITVVNRTESRACRLVDELTDTFPQLSVAASPWTERVDLARDDSLIINCTPVGMDGIRTPGGESSPWPADAPLSAEQVVADLVYTPQLTPLLIRALKEGLQGVPGLGMLVHQAALSFAWWTDASPPVEAMHEALTHQAGCL